MSVLAESPVVEALAYEVPERKSVAVDFDGVIHSYVSGWEGADVISDAPVPGAIDFLNELAEHFTVVIFTTRAAHEGAPEAISDWLTEHGFSPDSYTITATKGPAIFYLDDRAWRFRGVFPTMQQIRRAYPWRVGSPLPGETWKRKREQERKTIGELERKLGKRKAELHQLRDAARAVIEYFPDEETMPPVVVALKGFLK